MNGFMGAWMYGLIGVYGVHGCMGVWIHGCCMGKVQSLEITTIKSKCVVHTFLIPSEAL